MLLLQGGTCAMTQTRYCVFTPDKPANAASLANLMRTQVHALSDPTPSLGI